MVIDTQVRIENLERSDPAIIQTLLSHPWLSDDTLHLDEIRLLYVIGETAKTDLPLARRMAAAISDPALRPSEPGPCDWRVGLAPSLDLPWLEEELDSTAQEFVNRLGGLEHCYPSVYQTLVRFPWITDSRPTGRLESEVVWAIHRLADADLSLAHSVMALPWFADGVTAGPELYSLDQIANLAPSLPEIALKIGGLPWIADGVTRNEQHLLQVLEIINRSNFLYPSVILGDPTPVVQRLAETHWFVSGNAALHPSVNSALLAADTALFEEITGQSWFQDGLTDQEAELVLELVNPIPNEVWIALRSIEDLALYERIVSQPWYQDGLSAQEEGWALALARLESVPQYERIISEYWHRDGLTDEDTAWLLALAGVASMPEDTYPVDDLLEELIEERHVVYDTVSLPSGEVRLAAVSRAPFRADGMALDALRAGVRTIQDFVDRPWPTLFVIALLEPFGADPGTFTHGRYFGGDFTLVEGLESFPGFRATLYHELGHYYFYQRAPHWLTEGAAEFLAMYTVHAVENRGIQSRYLPGSCPLSNIQEYIEATAGHGAVIDPRFGNCPYYLGGSLLIEMYRSLGHEMVASSLRELHSQIAVSPDRLTEAEIYQAFLSNTPPDKQDAFRDLYRRLHGGIP